MNLNAENEYHEAIEIWKKEVADTCDNFAKNKDFDLDLDFYVFQSSVRFAPPLLMIGANPGGQNSYTSINKTNNRHRRTTRDLGYDANQFLVNPAWHSSSLCSLFSGEKLLPMFENAVITNLIYFNTNKFDIFRKRTGARNVLDFCKKSNRQLINILQPKNIILMGNISLEGLTQFFDKPMIPILETIDGKSALIRQTSINGIPTFWICHPSMNKKFNTGINLEFKKNKLEKILYY
jgi:hypothetical protein